MYTFTCITATSYLPSGMPTLSVYRLLGLGAECSDDCNAMFFAARLGLFG